jgi:hypothetical protein
MTTPTTLTARIADLVLEASAAELAKLYAPDALVDVNVPQWRYQVLGADVEPFLRDEFEQPDGEVVSHRVTYFEDGVMIEAETRFTEGGETRLWRNVNIFRTDGDRVVEHTAYCTGVWDAATIARQAVEAPMVRP